MTHAPLLEVDIVEKRYGERVVLGPLAMQIAAGEVVALVGASGCGKSTLLRIVAGLDPATRGTVRIDGASVHEPSPAVGVVFQEPRLLPWLSVADNVAFAAGHRRGKLPAVKDLLREVGLAEWGGALPKQLSGGMAQRAAIARALFTQPRLLLLDEPFSAVDALTRHRLQTMLLDVVRQHRTAALLITHDIDEALYLADRVLVMRGGPGRLIHEIALPAARTREHNDPALAAQAGVLLDQLEAVA
jgi:sulfonate transport system ATP-binding protein